MFQRPDQKLPPSSKAALSAFLLACLLMLGSSCSKTEPSSAQESAGPEKPGQKTQKFERIEKVKQQRYTDCLKALDELDAIAKAPQNADEQKTATELLPELLELAFHKDVQSKAYDAARTVLQRLVTEFPESPRTRPVQVSWGYSLATMFGEACRANDPAQAEALFAEYRNGGFYLPANDLQPRGGSADVLEQYVAFQLKRWKQLPVQSRQTGQGFRLASDGFSPVLDDDRFWKMLRDLETDPKVFGQETAALADSFQHQGMTAAALNATRATYFLLRDDQWDGSQRPMDYRTRETMQQNLETRIADLALQLAGEATKPGGVVMADRPADFLGSIAERLQSPAQAARLREAQLDIASKEYVERTQRLLEYDPIKVAQDFLPYEQKRELSDFLHLAVNATRNIHETLRHRIFQTWIVDTNNPIWTKVTPQTLAEVQRRLPPNLPVSMVEQQKRELFLKLVDAGVLPNPVGTSTDFAERRLQVLALHGVAGLDGNREEAFRELRTAMHDEHGVAAEPVQKSVQAVFGRASKQGNLEALIELAGFYAAEFGDGLKTDPFRGELQKGLESSAAKFKSGDKMKYLFVEALLAQIFPAEEVGRKAQDETIRGAFEAVQNVPAETRTPDLRLPSLIEGWSTVAVDNSTEHHILAVYDGPERFAVLCNPLRKGSFALKNGKYRIAVVTPIGTIRPYRQERTFDNEHALSEYYVRTIYHEAGTVTGPTSSTHGEYRPLRETEQIPGYQVNAKTGMFTKQ